MTQAPSCYQYAVSEGQSLANLQRHLPTGMAWDAWRTPGTVAYRLLAAVSKAYDDMTAALCRLAFELNPYTTEQLLPEWERAVSLPDTCLPEATTLDQRRAWVAWRLEKRRWTTAQDWIELATLFGLEITVTPGWLVQKHSLFRVEDDGVTVFPEIPMRFDDFPKLGRFRVYIDVVGIHYDGFEYGGDNGTPGFPIAFDTGPTILQQFMCLIDRVRPANVVVIWNDNPLRNGCYAEIFGDEFADTFC